MEDQLRREEERAASLGIERVSYDFTAPEDAGGGLNAPELERIIRTMLGV